ncbi:MAG: protein kinase [Symploca sp. SIO1C2]|nr:protein kinase [Symploca sp. SIO1C2]
MTAALMIGQILRQRYQIIDKLGSGGVGETYLADDLDIPVSPKPKCVVKRLHPKAIDSDTQRLFQTEAEILYKLGQDYDQIPQLFAYFEENQEFYLVQELIEGNNLSQEIIVGKPWSEARVIQLLRELLEILAYVHQHNVIHRDIKPSNLMRRRRDDKLILIDFGAVKQVSSLVAHDSDTENRTIGIGTFGYMPGEQALGKPRLSSDVYAVGMVAIQALTGIAPNQLPEDDKGEILWEKNAQVSEALRNILNQMVRYHFSDRYPSAIEALAELNLQIPPSETELPSSPEELLKPVKIDGKYGYKDTTGAVVIPPQFDRAGKFSEGLAEVKLGSKYGYIQSKGKMVIPPQFEKAGSFAGGVAKVKIDNCSTYINQAGERLFEEVSSFCEGLARIRIGSRYGYINNSKQVVIPPQFEKAWSFSEGLALVTIDNRYGYIDQAGKMIIKPQFEKAWSFSQGLALVTIEGKYGYIDTTGELVTQLFDEAWSSTEGRAKIEIKNKLLGILPIGKQYRTIDQAGKFIDS